MKRTFRLLALSAVVLTALGFTAVGALALTPVTRIGAVTTSATPESKDEAVGTVTVTDIPGTQTVTTQDLTGTVEPVETETASPDINHSSGEQNGQNQVMTTNNINRDSGNGSGQNMGGSNTGLDSQNGSSHDSGNASNNSSGSGGN